MTWLNTFLHPQTNSPITINKDIHMSLLSSFIASHLIPVLESSLGAYEPQIQGFILTEIKSLSDELSVWLEAKINPVPAPTDAQTTVIPATQS